MIRRLLPMFALLLPIAALAAISDEEPLPPEQAFQLSATAKDPNTVRATWTIAEGYYLYREKFQFKPETAGITLGTPSFPKGKIKEDEFFGKVESYRHQVAVDIPVNRSGVSGDTLQLTTVYQGCADLGVCYPPQTQKVSIKLPPAVAASTPAPTNSVLPRASTDGGAFGALKKLGSSFGLSGNDEPFLEVDKAFAYSSEVVDGNTIVARWKIADGYYLYREKFGFDVKDATGISIGTINFPQGQIKNDESFGRMEVYHDGVELRVPLVRTVTTPTNVTFIARYQGCAEKGFCYPPQESALPMALPVATSQPNSGAQMKSVDAPIAPISEQDQIAASLAGGSTFWVILSFFGFGLLLAFTPCVFPMIPILSSIIVGQGEGLSTRRAFTLSLIYVLAMAVTYTVAGVIAGMFGSNVQAAFQNPWILGSFAAIFVVLSLSMFGFYELQMPSFIQSKLTEISNKQKGGTLVGVGIMGFLSALIVGPCVAAPLAGALIYIGQTGDAVLGGIALFALSMGMGAPLLAIGTSAGKVLPRAGTWMETIKAVFGVLLLAVAIWMIERIIPAQVALFLWALLLIISSIYMGALEPHGIDATGWKKLWKGVGLAMLTYGVVLVIGAASGARDMFQPLHNLALGSGGTANATAAESHLTFKRIRGIDALEREIAAANAQGKPVMLDFYADWCISCKEMEKFTFSDADVRSTLAQAVLIQADVTANDDTDKALLKRLGVIGPPSILFFGTDGQERRAYRLVGFIKPKEFRTHVERAFNS